MVFRLKCTPNKKVTYDFSFSRLNEIRSGRGNMFLVLESGYGEVLDSDIFHCKVLWVVSAGERNSIGFLAL